MPFKFDSTRRRRYITGDATVDAFYAAFDEEILAKLASKTDDEILDMLLETAEQVGNMTLKPVDVSGADYTPAGPNNCGAKSPPSAGGSSPSSTGGSSPSTRNTGNENSSTMLTPAAASGSAAAAAVNFAASLLVAVAVAVAAY